MAGELLLGAGLGLGTSLLTKQDPLKGAALGAITSGIGLGAKEMMQGAGIMEAPLQALPEETFVKEFGSMSPTVGAAAPEVANAVAPATNLVGSDANKGILGSIGESWNKLPEEKKWLYGGVGALGAASMLQGLNAPGMPQDKSKPFFKYDPRKYRPTFYAAEGGVVPGADQYATGGGIANLYTSGHGPLDQPMDGIQQVPNQQDLSSVPAAGYLGQSVKMMASGGISDLGGYSDGGRLLKGPGDGVSDDIPASIGGRQPARLADGEFVIPARIVSELGNGSTDAGARQLYKMMARVENARKRSVGKNKIAKDTKAAKHLPV